MLQRGRKDRELTALRTNIIHALRLLALSSNGMSECRRNFLRPYIPAKYGCARRATPEDSPGCLYGGKNVEATAKKRKATSSLSGPKTEPVQNGQEGPKEEKRLKYSDGACPGQSVQETNQETFVNQACPSMYQVPLVDMYEQLSPNAVTIYI